MEKNNKAIKNNINLKRTHVEWAVAGGREGGGGGIQSLGARWRVEAHCWEGGRPAQNRRKVGTFVRGDTFTVPEP